ncbi:hypothetical protein AUC68_14090 [Methyloceanibacter methanicus]|uniref:Uncharacterized protein n=1 Tax=Methyloceanibacter methanicus TaxID=1774968 RepID=A0A1E3W4I9_9HYPH|nr:hypothetical protein [Methyloceanibacter methanicus]ODS00711.1 hypothetical protein AUC68_14090 [Methyloceanibacter methanicus]
MNLRKNVVMVALAALVTGTAVLVYVLGGTAAASDKLPDPVAEAARPQSGPKVLYDATATPKLVQRILKMIILAAETGDIEEMRAVLESNELKPMVAAKHIDDPIAYWKAQSVDGTGRDILATMLDMLSTGFVLTGKGDDEMYVWPYFAETDLSTLSPQQQVAFYRLVPPKQAKAMLAAGKYSGYRLGVAPNGIWHYFLK